RAGGRIDGLPAGRSADAMRRNEILWKCETSDAPLLDCRTPEIGIHREGRVFDTGEMKGFPSLDTSATASTMMFATLVAGPRCGKGRAIFCAIDNDVGFGNVHIRREQFYVGIAVQCMVLHGLESINKIGAAIGIDEMITAMDGERHSVGLLCGG